MVLVAPLILLALVTFGVSSCQASEHDRQLRDTSRQNCRDLVFSRHYQQLSFADRTARKTVWRLSSLGFRQLSVHQIQILIQSSLSVTGFNICEIAINSNLVHNCIQGLPNNLAKITYNDVKAKFGSRVTEEVS